MFAHDYICFSATNVVEVAKVALRCKLPTGRALLVVILQDRNQVESFKNKLVAKIEAICNEAILANRFAVTSTRDEVSMVGVKTNCVVRLLSATQLQAQGSDVLRGVYPSHVFVFAVVSGELLNELDQRKINHVHTKIDPRKIFEAHEGK
jgi:hypothetical protein